MSQSASVLQVWFPAQWAVRVETRLCSLSETASEYRAEHAQSAVPNVRCNIKLPGQSMDVEHLLQRFPTVLRGIVQGVFRQQAGGAWFPCRDLKVFSCLSPASHIIGLGPWHAEKAPGQWNFQTRALLRFFTAKPNER